MKLIVFGRLLHYRIVLRAKFRYMPPAVDVIAVHFIGAGGRCRLSVGYCIVLSV